MNQIDKEAQHEARRELKLAELALKKDRQKKKRFVLLGFVLVIILFKIMYGYITIEAKFPNNTFDLYINNTLVEANSKQELSRDFIPFLIRFYGIYLDEPSTTNKIISKSNKYTIKLDTYECIDLETNSLIECSTDNSNQVLVSELDYNLKINQNDKTIYDGVYIEDITNYIDEGSYQITIYNKRGSVYTYVTSEIIIN